jgi:WD40 repeat protein
MSPVGTLVYSPDGKRLASCVEDEVKLWDAEIGHELLEIKKARGMSLVFSPDGHRLIGGGAEGVTIWDASPLPEKP